VGFVFLTLEVPQPDFSVPAGRRLGFGASNRGFIKFRWDVVLSWAQLVLDLVESARAMGEAHQALGLGLHVERVVGGRGRNIQRWSELRNPRIKREPLPMLPSSVRLSWILPRPWDLIAWQMACVPFRPRPKRTPLVVLRHLQWRRQRICCRRRSGVAGDEGLGDFVAEGGGL
jgi:hypothetical protein